MRINIVAFDNGVGNSRDVVLMRAAVEAAGHEVTVTSVGPQARRLRRSPVLRVMARWRRLAGAARGRSRAHYDCNLLLEHVWPQALPLARRNIVVPNPEWFDPADQSTLRLADAVWTKTQYAQQIFGELGLPCRHVGFDSVDRHLPDVVKEPRFLHLAGKSRMKGTGRLLDVWRRHPQWPELSVVHSRAGVFVPAPAANIRYLDGYLGDQQLRELQNSHRFHLCTSETEGWGHYIPEALSTGAITLATDAPPMNELVSAERGLLIASRTAGRQHLATRYEFVAEDLERQVQRALTLDAQQCDRLAAAARAWFLANKQAFRQRVSAALRVDRLV